MQYTRPPYFQQGYSPLGNETGEYAQVADSKHFWQYGDPKTRGMLTVDEIPDLRPVSEELYDQFNDRYRILMHVVAVTLKLDPGFFDAQLGNSIIRRIHYPGVPNPATRDDEVATLGGNAVGMCASMHTDINDLTLLHATQPGLQLRHNGEWIPVQCGTETIIVNAGDMLQHLTGGRYQSGMHRVVCQPGIDRTASPFFGHRWHECSVEPLPHLGPSDLEKFPFKTEGAFFDHRIKQITKQI